VEKLRESVIHPDVHPRVVDLDEIDIGHQHPMMCCRRQWIHGGSRLSCSRAISLGTVDTWTLIVEPLMPPCLRAGGQAALSCR
jgi:hypothetical protein